MEFYFILLTLLHLIFYRSKSKVLYLISLVGLLFFAGYRGNTVGYDTMNYFLHFQSLQQGRYSDMHEPLWELINMLVIKMGGDFDDFKVVVSALTLLPLYYGIYRTSKQPLFSIFVFLTFYYYFYGFNIMRQCLAMSWGFLGLTYLKEEVDRKTQLVKPLLWTIVGILFHYTGIVFIGMYVVYFLTKSKKNWYAIQIASLIIGVVFGGYLLRVALVFFAGYQDVESREGTIGTLVNLAIINIVFVVVNNIVVRRDKWFSFFFCFVILSNLMCRVPYAPRIVMYAGVTLSVFFPLLLVNNKLEKGFRPVLWTLIVLYCYYRFSRQLGLGQIFPYTNTLFNLA